VADVNDYLGPVRPWFEEHCIPIVDALYAEDLPVTQAALDRAWSAHVDACASAVPPFDADGCRALEYALLQFDFELANHFDAPTVGLVHQAVVRRLRAARPLGPLSDRAQAFILLTLIGMGTRRQFMTASEAEIDALLARIPEHARTPNLYYYLVAWAFFNNNLRYLELAFTDQMVRTTGWLDEYYWQRTNLMYLLASGRATVNDVRETIQRYRHPRQIVDFRNLFLARVEQAGLWDAKLGRLLAEREAELEQLRGTLPEAQPRTRRILGRVP
jgi:hypothetical protein